ncbi:MAG: DoxX family protein [Halobacteriovoraceae bacterium]|nr:DoxX family protein [Halobacteriovoraceae bacterium]
MLFKKHDIGILILRLTIGFLMLLHGIAKAKFGISFIEGLVVSKGLPHFFAYGVYIGEILAPLAIIVGFRTKLACLIFAFNCLVAIYLVHIGDLFSLSKNGGWAIELIGIYLFASVALFFLGGGKLALSRKSNWD